MTAAMAAAANLMARAAAIHHLPGVLPHVGAETNPNQRAAELAALQMNLGNNSSPISDHGSPPQTPTSKSLHQTMPPPLKGLNLTTSSLQNNLNEKLRLINNDDKFSSDEEENRKDYDIEVTKKLANGRRQADEEDDDLEV